MSFIAVYHKFTYRIIPNKRAGRGDEVGGAFIMCTKMLICISPPHSAVAQSLSHATLVQQLTARASQRSTLTVVRWSETPRNHVGPPEHSNPVVRWTTEIFGSKQNRNMAKKSKQSSPLAANNTRNTLTYRSRHFSRNKTSVYNHAGHELLRSRLTIPSSPFYGTKDMCS